MIKGKLACDSIGQHSNIKQAGVTYPQFEQWEKTELISNFIYSLINKKEHFYWQIFWKDLQLIKRV